MSEAANEARRGLPVSHGLLALLIMGVWGTNFVVARIGLTQFPPLLFGTLRFIFVLFPAVIFIRRPTVRLRRLFAYGILVGAGQFGALYVALQGYISPGLASLLVQSQVFLTILLSAIIFSDQIKTLQIAALGLAAIGIALVALESGGETTTTGIVLVLIAALAWACANLLMKGAAANQMVAYVVWASWFSIPPLLILSLVVEGPSAIALALIKADFAGWAAMLWQSVGNSLFGFAAWGWLLARHPAPMIAPTALLVPVFGMIGSAVFLHEHLNEWKLVAAGFVIAGLLVNLAAGRSVRTVGIRLSRQNNLTAE